VNKIIKIIIFFIYFLTLFSCKQSENQTKKSLINSINELEIYNFMEIVIIDQKLNKSYGLDLQSERYCNINKTDYKYLKQFIIDTFKISKSDTSLFKESNLYIKVELNYKCLTQKDVDFMLDKKNIRNSSFKIQFQINIQ